MEIQYRTQLPDLLRHYNLPLVAVELGCAEGYSASDFLEAGIEKLYMVDAWRHLDQRGDGGESEEWHENNYNDAMKRVSKYGDKVVVLRGTTDEMVDYIPYESVSLVYVDAAHDYNSVSKDIVHYFHKLIHGGIMAFHDYVYKESYGVVEAVNEFCAAAGYEVHVIPENKYEDQGCWFMKK